MPKKYVVSMDAGQRAELEQLVRCGTSPARRLIHARVLLKADAGDVDEEIAESLDVSVRTVERVRRRFSGEGVAAALDRRPQPPRPARRKLDGDGEAHLVALACSAPPDGRPEWTLQLLADRMVELKHVERGVSYETVRRCLKKTRRSRG
jgi:transposase